jgi:hypothetical protein
MIPRQRMPEKEQSSVRVITMIDLHFAWRGKCL